MSWPSLMFEANGAPEDGKRKRVRNMPNEAKTDR
jgi:hypothetical protein